MRDLWRLAWRSGLLLALNACLGAGMLCLLGWGARMQPWETDSIFQGNRLDESYDLVLMGTSRTYLLSRYEANQRTLESGLGRNVLNLALPAAGGIKPAYAYLTYCLDHGVHPKEILYCIDPFVLFQEACNENHKFVYFEAFRPGFLVTLAKQDFAWRRLLIYVRNKFSLEWLASEPIPLPRFDAVSEIPLTPERIKPRVDSLYPEGLKDATFNRYAPYLDRILERCKQEGIKVRMVTLPTLIGPEPGQPALEAYIGKLHERYDFTYENWCNAMPVPEYYFDLDHENSVGVKHLVAEHLVPLLGSNKGV